MYWGTLSRQECEPRRELCKSVPRVSRDAPPPCAKTSNPNCKLPTGRREVWPPCDLASHLPRLLTPSPGLVLPGDAAGEERNAFHHQGTPLPGHSFGPSGINQPLVRQQVAAR